MVRSQVQDEISFEEFHNDHHGDHPGYQNGTILTILNLQVALMPHIKFQPKPTYGFGATVENVNDLTKPCKPVLDKSNKIMWV